VLTGDGSFPSKQTVTQTTSKQGQPGKANWCASQVLQEKVNFIAMKICADRRQLLPN
jgi:hypothetical protein